MYDGKIEISGNAKAEELRRQCIDIALMKEDYDAITDKYKASEKLFSNSIKAYMERLGTNKAYVKYRGSDGMRRVNFSLVNKSRKVLNIEKIEKNVDCDLVEQIIKKDYRIIDFEKFKKVMSRYGVKGSDLKGIVMSSKIVDQEQFESLTAQGWIEKTVEQKCYDTFDLSSHLEIGRSYKED